MLFSTHGFTYFVTYHLQSLKIHIVCLTPSQSETYTRQRHGKGISAMQKQFEDDLKSAMRARDSIRRGVIRYILSDIHNQEIAKQKALDDESIIDLLSKQAQQRRESIQAFNHGNRHDLADKEGKELDIILQYLPQQMSPEEITYLVKDAVEEIGATGPQDMGKIMGNLMPKIRGKAQGKEVSAIVTVFLKNMAGVQ